MLFEQKFILLCNNWGTLSTPVSRVSRYTSPRTPAWDCNKYRDQYWSNYM